MQIQQCLEMHIGPPVCHSHINFGYLHVVQKYFQAVVTSALTAQKTIKHQSHLDRVPFQAKLEGNPRNLTIKLADFFTEWLITALFVNGPSLFLLIRQLKEA